LQTVSTDKAPPPAGHYSQAVVHGGVVYVAGQLPKDPADPSRPPGDAAAQTRRVFANIAAILEAAGSGLGRILQVTIYVTDIALWPQVNDAYATLMGDHRPARAVVPVGTLHGGYLLEVIVVAAAG
jgi:2-iminobutanoate/2-iminopropanoate deaminase